MPDQMRITLADRLQALAQEVADDIEASPGPGADAAQKMVVDIREAAAQLAEVDSLLELILDEMAAANARDLATDGPVGDEEGAVWRKIEAAAKALRERYEMAEPEPAA